jgi:hypothetical protein
VEIEQRRFKCDQGFLQCPANSLEHARRFDVPGASKSVRLHTASRGGYSVNSFGLLKLENGTVASGGGAFVLSAEESSAIGTARILEGGDSLVEKIHITRSDVTARNLSTGAVMKTGDIQSGVNAVEEIEITDGSI